MAADHFQETAGDSDADARVRIQEIIEDLNLQELNLTEPGNQTLDGKIELLDKIFTDFVEDENEDQGPESKGKSVNVSQARLDIVAFSKLASINHQRIRRVAASSWTFRATDFANRIVRLMNVDEGSQSESLSDATKVRLDQMVQPHFNQCVPLKPLLGAITLTKIEVVAKEKRQRQPRTQEKVVAQKVQPRKITDITEEDQNTKVAKHVEYIHDCLRKEYKRRNKKPISFYEFVIDPTSFSNSVENIFYVSFLIKDGFVSLKEDEENGLPMLNIIKRSRESTAAASASKKQLIIALDQNMWKDIVQGLGLEKAIIDQNMKNDHSHKEKRPRHE